MPARKPRPADAESQPGRLIDTAREPGLPVDEATSEAFKAKLGEITRPGLGGGLAPPKHRDG